MRHALCLSLCLCACVEAPDEPSWLVDAVRVLAIEADPPQAAPGAMVQLRAWAVDARGDVLDHGYQFGFCRDAKAVGENRVAAAGCVDGNVARLTGDAFERSALLPSDACRSFGPLAGPNLRPRDPDDSGGYYQPLRVEAAGAIAIALLRLDCPLPNLPIDASLALRDRARDNTNPELASVELEVAGAPGSFDAVPRDRDVVLRADIAAGSAESYVIFDPASASVQERAERLRLAWFVTAGTLDAAETAASDHADNTWHTPRDERDVRLWLVLRDDRGGVRVREEVLHVGE